MDRPPASVTLVSVAWRGSNDDRPVSVQAIAAAFGPLKRTTPIPPRPGGVAMATIVSSVENMADSITPDLKVGPTGAQPPASNLGWLFLGNDDRLQKCIPDALRRHRGILGDGQVDQAARVRIQRADFLRA